MNLIDHVLNIRVLIHRALEAQMERSGMDATEREEKLKPCVFTLFRASRGALDGTRRFGAFP